MKTAAKLLLEARKVSGLTQAALARRARIPRSVLNAYERGHRDPGVEALTRILRAASFELRVARSIDDRRNARILSDVLDLAERLPWRPRKTLGYPPLRGRRG